MCKHKGYVLTLRTDLNEEEEENLLTALQQLKGVIAIAPLENDFESWMSREQARHDILKQLHEFLDQI